MRDALGYPRWNLWGGSYGTRVAQEYLRRSPDRVRTMTLDGVAPPGMVITLDVWRTREAALAAIFNTCEAQPAAGKRTRTSRPRSRRSARRWALRAATSTSSIRAPANRGASA